MAWMLGKDGKMVFVEPGTPVYGEIPAPLAMNIVNPQDGQALVYDGTKGEWVNGGSFDPTITDPQDGDTLVYDATAGAWKNGEGGGGGGGHALVATATFTLDGYSIDHVSLDKTAGEIWEAFRTGSVIVVCDTVPPFNTAATWSLIFADHANNYGFTAYTGEISYTFTAPTETDYPAYYPENPA